MQSDFERFRIEYPVFVYDGFHTSYSGGLITIRFDFSVPGLCEFHPETKIVTDNLSLLNAFDSSEARKILFALGMVEAVSYWKCVCSPEFVIRCGELSGEDKLWWKKLWYNGLGEFFYKNGIVTDEESFVEIKQDGGLQANGERKTAVPFRSGGWNLIPVGGGKDSCVTLDLLKDRKKNNICFTVNDQPARTQTAAAAGYSSAQTIRTIRVIDGELLKRNAEGFLNGHTPFSSIVAFLSMYCAYIIGAENIILSNEASANEATLRGSDINHQYSKSYAFEADFNEYVKRNRVAGILYFSLLRPFNELQIAKKFAALRDFHPVFRSCNAGSKSNSWCGKCAKCLFVYIILSPFMEREELIDIFGGDLLGKKELLEDFEALAGILDDKPFECVGTVEEVRCALEMTVQKYVAGALELPALLRHYNKKVDSGCGKSPAEMLSEFNPENCIPEEFKKYTTEMYNYVSKTD
jgi:UDP-N-acetyl-alpha-D-muramoyl-L-alanyl-L-glutamate epimerase